MCAVSCPAWVWDYARRCCAAGNHGNRQFGPSLRGVFNLLELISVRLSTYVSQYLAQVIAPGALYECR